MAKIDKELQHYRTLMEIPSKFEDGFSYSSLLGAFFVGLVMIPGVLYMELMAGMGIGPAGQWVTVILFVEVAKRANATLSRAQIYILFYMAGAVANQHVYGTPLFVQFFVQSDAAIGTGIAPLIPHWVAPINTRELPRSFFQWAWAPAVALIIFRFLFSKLDNMVLGYGLFRLTNDIEKLPFPLAPIGAQGLLALSEDLEGDRENKVSWRWRIFCIGGAIGMVFGVIYMALPILSGAILGQTLTIFPIPFVDWTDYTKDILPAVATGFSFDLGMIILGMVMPFYAMLGSFLGLAMTYILNPILYYNEYLHSWRPGDSTIETLFKDNLDFYFSLTIGLSAAVALVGVSHFFHKSKPAEAVDEPEINYKERGDIPFSAILAAYMFTSLSCVLLSGYLVDWHFGVMMVLIFFAYFYTPLISYVTARLEGMAGQVVEIPMIREIAFILSGYVGVEIWFIPVPKGNYGMQTVYYKQAELTGTKFKAVWKTDLLLFPIILLATIGFSSYIWSLGPVPSSVYPYAQEVWDLEAKNACLMYSATLGEYSQFQEALSLPRVLLGFGMGMGMYGLLAFFNMPSLIFYGFVRGLGSTLPHVIAPQFLGALIGRMYFSKKYGGQWIKAIPVLSAGYMVGVGLISVFCIGIVFLSKAAHSLPY